MTLALLEEELAELKCRDLYRQLRTFEKPDGVRAVLKGKEILLFCGNDYLGLSQHPRVIGAAQKAASEYGVGSGAARLISGTSDLHAQLEERIARFKNKERALVFTAGYLANVGTLTALAGENDLIVMDKLCHASLIDGARLSGATLRVFPHKNYERCREILGKGDFKKRILVSDTVFSMDGDLADLEELIRLKDEFEGLLIVDDAHGTGVYGREGRGAAEDLNVESKIDIILGTFSKAFGVLGGFATAQSTVIEYLINFSRPFIFATSPPPMICAAILESLTLIEEQPALRERLWQNVKQAYEGLKSAGFKMGPVPSPIMPLIVGEEKNAIRLSQLLYKEGLFIPAIRYPTVPRGKARLRITLSSAHTPKDIESLLITLKEVI